jgi:peptidoglycan/xylan/chitin deacetylase (PgdA/CDA1 family)
MAGHRRDVVAAQPQRRLDAAGLAADLLAKTGLGRSLTYWNGRRGGVILAFHEISRQLMERQLEAVAATCSFIHLDELVQRLATGRSTRGVAAITLDDGVGRVTESAAEIAVRRRWPMTFFLPTRSLDQGRVAWYHELPTLLHAARGRTVVVDGSAFRLVGTSDVDRAIDALTARFKDCTDVPAVEGLLQHLRAAVHAPDAVEESTVFAPLTWTRVKELARHDMLSFQAHSVTHLAMSRLTPACIEQEMTNSQARIEEVTGRPVRHFCYPYGYAAQIGPTAASIARRVFRSSVTMERGRCTRGVDLALLPRIPLYERDTANMVNAKIALA